MGRAPCCDKAKVKRGPWSPEEDATLINYLQLHGTGGNWIALPQKAGLKRCGKSCRLRWLNYLRPDIKHGGFTEEEDNVIFSLYSQMGSRWSFIASRLPGRTDNDVKNYWNTKLKKKLLLGGGTSQEINHQPTNPSTVSSSQSSFVPTSEPSSTTPTFWDSITQNSDTLPMLSDISHDPIINSATQTLSLDPIHQFSCPNFIIDVDPKTINSHIVWSSQEGPSISDSSSIAIEYSKQPSLPSDGDHIINLEEERLLMDYGFNFSNYDIFYEDNKASALGSTCYPNLDG